jgi:hypothetical protein
MLGSLTIGGVSTAAVQPAMSEFNATEVQGNLNPLNSSGVVGHAEIEVRNGMLDVDVHARGLLAGSPHAQHIHFGAQARNECPTIADDDEGDFRIDTTDGLPAYGPIKKSLTTRGDTSPASALAVNRFPSAPRGVINYDRTMSAGTTLAQAIKSGKGVIVIHGVDYNGNGMYDFASAGTSDLDPSLPAEATDPATCGVLR